MNDIEIYHRLDDLDIEEINRCPNCGEPVPTDSWLDYISNKEVNFCFYCGAQMRDKIYINENDISDFKKYLEEDE